MASEKRLILGIDPGLQTTGWALIVWDPSHPSLSYQTAGILQTKPKEPLSVRLACLADGLERLLSQYQPTEAAMEMTFVNANAQSSLNLSMARGALAAMVGRQSISLAFYSPTAIKAGLCGHGHADKSSVLDALSVLFGTETALDLKRFKSLDPSDALAIAWYHTQNMDTTGSFR